MITTNNVALYNYNSDMIELTRVGVAGRALLYTTRHDLDGLQKPSLSTPALTVPPRFYFTDGSAPRTFQLIPTPATGYALDFVYLPYPVPLIGNSDTFLVGDAWVPYLKYYALSRAWSKQGEGQDLYRSAFAKARYSMALNIAIRFLEGDSIQLQELVNNYLIPIPEAQSA
jgi:hypothetical protein